MRKYSAIYVDDAQVCRVVFEAADDDRAVSRARLWGLGLEGEAPALPERSAAIEPIAYDVNTTRRLLGGVSRSSIYADLSAGLLDRVPNTRRVLITRESIERRCLCRPPRKS